MSAAVAMPMGLPSRGLDSAGALLALLEEEDEALQAHALGGLHQIVDTHWAEISESILTIEMLSEDDRFGHRELAASVASRCFYHLEEFEDALRLALAAGEYFDINSTSEYCSVMVGKCIETYITIRSENAAAEAESSDDAAATTEAVDPRLESIVEQMFERCYSQKAYRQALGVALEARRLDKVEAAIRHAGDGGFPARVSAMLVHTLDVCQNLVSSRSFRLEVLDVLVRLFREHIEAGQPARLSLSLCTCLYYLDCPDDVAEILLKLVCCPEDSDDYLVAYQATFDLVEVQDKRFATRVLHKLAGDTPEATTESTEGNASGENEGSDASMANEGGDATAARAADLSDVAKSRLEKLCAILGKGTVAAMHLDFLYRSNKSDQLLLKNLKTSSEAGRKNSVLHGGMVVAHGFMQCGTTNDSFLRSNLEWLGQASNWAKLTATATLGVIHRGNTEPCMNLLAPYLPSDGGGPSQSPYSEGGALYALGLIHSAEGIDNKSSEDALEYLKSALALATTQDNDVAREALQHGACLGLGLIGMSSSNEGVLEQLRNVLYQDSAVASEAAALGMGLLMMGSGQKHASTIQDMLGYAKDTGHEKIIRGLAMAVSFTMYGKEEVADVLVEQLCRDKDPLLRYGGIYTVGMAYAGTANNGAIRRLLHVAVSDVANDVRRAAVTCIGLLLCRSPSQLPQLIALLSESYNPHVRYGACIALGIGCCSDTSSAAAAEALVLLKPLMDDKVDFVRQGAMLASAMLLQGHSPAHRPRAKALRKKITALAGDAKHASTMTRLGALLTTGLIDAGGRNGSISLVTRSGVIKPTAVVGMALFAQYWFWYPMTHMLSLAMTPSALIAVNKDLHLPKSFEVKCEVDSSQFAYPAALLEKKAKTKQRIKTVALSTTAKAKAKEAAKKKKAEEGGAAMEIQTDESPPAAKQVEASAAKATKEGDGSAKAKSGSNSKAKKGKTSDDEPETAPLEPVNLQNPVRVTDEMRSSVKFFAPGESGARYFPVCSDAQHTSGVLVLTDSTPDIVDEELHEISAPPPSGAEDEADPPEPFEWTPPVV